MSATTHGFKAEVEQLLQLMIHSVYSNRDVFLRELLSNAADALDKARFEGLTESLLTASHDPAGIRIEVDAEAHTLTIEDDGIGMSEAEAVENLGTIAHSGTKAFLQAAKDGAEGATPNLIGQFGVGFYAVFMVAERVVVDTFSAREGAGGVRWSSEGAGSYTIEPPERTTRGTRITIELREDAAEYAEIDTIRRIVREHSNFLSWPILAGEDQLNSGKALWALRPSELSDDDANAFYREISFDFEDPLLRVHFQVDTPHQYDALLFVPSNQPYDLFTPHAERGPRFYARRVLIDDHAKALLPDWLRFLRGVVDSEDIPLNMSREMVQKTPIVHAIHDGLVKRVLKDLGKLAESDTEAYAKFWRNFGPLLKEGYYQDKWRFGEKILPLLRFGTLQGEADALTSLATYKSAMPEGQDTIWFITAQNRESALANPNLEVFRRKGFDVLVLTDPVDEWLVQSLESFEETPLKSVSRGELAFDDDPAEAQKLGSLPTWLAGVLGDGVAGVRPSSRLSESAAVLVDDANALSKNMERILKSANQEVHSAKRWLEINPSHPVIRGIASLHERGQDDLAEPLGKLLLDGAMLMDGAVEDAPAIGRRLTALMAKLTASDDRPEGDALSS